MATKIITKSSCYGDDSPKLPRLHQRAELRVIKPNIRSANETVLDKDSTVEPTKLANDYTH
eukprot:3575697-Amphidinium_carterae.1